MSMDDAEADEDSMSVHTVRTGITNRTSNSAPCLVPGTDDVITSGDQMFYAHCIIDKLPH